MVGRQPPKGRKAGNGWQTAAKRERGRKWLADSCQKGERQEMDFSSEPMEGTNLVKGLIKGFWLLEL